MSQNVIQPSFAAGELSPKLYGRVDQSIYRIGTRKMRNFFVHPAGCTSNRPGTEFIDEIADSSKRGRLIPFQFNGQVTYVLEFGDSVMRVFKDGGIVLGNSTERVVNGLFATDISGWSDASSGTNSAISWDTTNGGQLKLVTGSTTGSLGIARQQLTNCIAGETYAVTVQTTGATAILILAGNAAGDGTYLSANTTAGGTSTFSFTAAGTAVWLDLQLTAVSATATVKSVSVFGPDASFADIPYQLPTPYPIADIALLKYTQSADVMTFCHPSYQPQDLGRTGDAAWSFTPVTFAPQVARPTGLALSVATSGSGTYRYKVTAVNSDGTEESLPGLSTSVAITGITNANPAVITIPSGHGLVNGDEILIQNVIGMTDLNDQTFLVNIPTGSATTAELRSIDNSNVDSTGYDAYVSGGTASECFVKTTAAASLSSTNTITVKWASQPGVSKFNVYREDSGTFGIIGSSQTTSFKDIFIATDDTTTPPSGRNPFAGGNWPSTVAYHEQRKFFANSVKQPQTFWATQTGNFKNMNVSSPTQDDDAITRTLVASQVNAIKHMVSMNVLIMLTSGAEWKCFPGSNNDAITPANCYTKPQSFNGSSDLQPIAANDTILYVQEKGSVVRDIQYDFASDSYTGTDRSVWADHLFHGHSIVDWGYAQEPFRIIWAVREDGMLLGFTYMKEQSVFGWHRHDTDGFFESVAVISEDGEDVAYFIVRREINGATKRYVERLHSRQFSGVADAWFLDCALEYSGEATNTVSGLDHLEGKTVGILGDGNVFPAAVVTGGRIALDNPASQIIIGLPYTAELETLDLDVGDPTIQGKRKKISAVNVKLEDSRGIKVGGVYENGDYTQLTEVKERSTQMYGTPIGLLTGQERVILDPTWNSNGRILIRQDNPLPCTILAAIPEVDVGA